MTGANAQVAVQAPSSTHKSALGALINVAGRQRMLSHRAVMFLSLSRIGAEQDRAALIASAAQALDGFEAGSRLLLTGDPESGLPALFSGRVEALLAEVRADTGISGRAVLDRFVSRGRACIDRLRAARDGMEAEILALSNLVAGDLLALLNNIVAAFEADLSDAMRAEAARAAEIHRTLSATLEDVEQLGQRINLIAFNALIEAARAGEAGKAFSIIAQEIKALGSQARAESAKMGLAVSRLFAV